jgi:hypothetical protein
MLNRLKNAAYALPAFHVGTDTLADYSTTNVTWVE